VSPLTPSPKTGAYLAAAGFLVIALDGLLSLTGLAFTWSRTFDTGDEILIAHPDILEFLGCVLIALGGALLFLRVASEVERVPRPILAGLFLLTAGAALRVLFYVLTVTLAPYLVGPEGDLGSWIRPWHTAVAALATGAVLLAASVSPPALRGVLGPVAAGGALAFVILLVTEAELTVTLTIGRDIALAALAAGMVGVGLGLKKNPYALFT